MSGQSDPVIQNIIELHSNSDHFGIIHQIRDSAFSPNKSAISNMHLVTWPLPSEKDLQTFAHFINSNGICTLYSIGCGTGLLEWLMHKFILDDVLRNRKSGDNGDKQRKREVKVVGIEVDSGWWNSSYSPPKFLPLKFSGEDFDHTKPFGGLNDMAIFCYFNNIKIFLEYLKSFRGGYVVLIGPISTEQFCSPGPMELVDDKTLPTHEWNLISCLQFGFISIDHIAIYRRNAVPNVLASEIDRTLNTYNLLETSRYNYLIALLDTLRYGIRPNLVLKNLFNRTDSSTKAILTQQIFRKYADSGKPSEFEELAYRLHYIEIKNLGYRLKLASLYMQATEGPNKTPEPKKDDHYEHSYWTVWTQLGNMSKAEAEKEYIRLAKLRLKEPDPDIEINL